jgi:hypothetical protein
MAGDRVLPPPLPYECPSDRHKAEQVFARRTCRGKESLGDGVRIQYGGGEAVG